MPCRLGTHAAACGATGIFNLQIVYDPCDTESADALPERRRSARFLYDLTADEIAQAELRRAKQKF
jgi:hypothetical protein